MLPPSLRYAPLRALTLPCAPPAHSKTHPTIYLSRHLVSRPRTTPIARSSPRWYSNNAERSCSSGPIRPDSTGQCTTPRLSQEEAIVSLRSKAENTPDCALRGLMVDPSTSRPGYSLTLPLTELPKLPPRPFYPCPWLSKSEVDAYVSPLIARGWRVVPSEEDTDGMSYLLLGKQFAFVAARDLDDFAVRLKELEEKAHHHGIVNKLNPRTLLYRMNTHSAVPSAKVDSEIQREVPGITMLDVRLAIRLERVWGEYVRSAKAELIA